MNRFIYGRALLLMIHFLAGSSEGDLQVEVTPESIDHISNEYCAYEESVAEVKVTEASCVDLKFTAI